MKKQNFTIPLVVYPFDVMVSFGQTDDELLKTLSKSLTDDKMINKDVWSDNEKEGRTIMFLSGQTLIRMLKVERNTYVSRQLREMDI